MFSPPLLDHWTNDTSQQRGKSEDVARPKEIFGDQVNITTEGQRHLGASLGSLDFKKDYCTEKVNSWSEQLKMLADTRPNPKQPTQPSPRVFYQSLPTFCVLSRGLVTIPMVSRR